MSEDEKILEKLEEVIQKKKDEIAGLNRLLGFIDQPSKDESNSKKENDNNESTDKSNS